MRSISPDKRRDTYKIDEWFVLSVVAKLEPEWFGAVVDETLKRRFEPKPDGDKIGEISMDKKLKEILMDSPF